MVISKKNLIANLSKAKAFLKTKIKSHGDEVTDFHNKKTLKAVSNHTCLTVVSLDSALDEE